MHLSRSRLSVPSGADLSMNGHPHLFRRGNTLQWRRRIKRLSTGFVDIKLSLRTSDLSLAVMLCRKLSAESDAIMNQAAYNLISDADARRWLSAVMVREREKIARLGLMRRVDSSDPADDLRHDVAMREAWSHIASQGIHAPVAPEADPLMAGNVDLLRADLTSDARRRIILRDFRELASRDYVSARETLAVLDLYIRGMSEAWTHPDSGPEQVTASGAEPVAVPAPDATVAMPPIPAPAEAPDADALDPDIMAVVARMNALKRIEGVEEKTLRQFESFVALFTKLTGIHDVRAIRQSHATGFRADLYRLPKSWGKSPKDAAASRDEIMARAASLPPDKVGLSIGTINRHLEHLSQIVGWADDEGILVDPKLKPEKLRRKESVRDREKRDAFSLDQLRRLSQHPTWQDAQTPRDGLFWAPLIAAYTGARRAEIAGLAVADIIEVDGVACINIDQNTLRRVKNLPSRRVLPIHSHLLELGLLDYVAAKRENGEGALFPEQREAAGGVWGRKLGRFMREVIDAQLGAEGEALSFHSYRHYVQNALDRLGVDDKIVRDVIGHEGRDDHEKTYRKQSTMRELQGAIEAMPRVM
jgi:integrase